METANLNRRPLKTRSSRWAQRVAAYLASTAISPNQISLLSVVFALAGASALLADNGAWSLVFCAVCIQLRLACNLLDVCWAARWVWLKIFGDPWRNPTAWRYSPLVASSAPSRARDGVHNMRYWRPYL